jgi:hypothetical protein
VIAIQTKGEDAQPYLPLGQPFGHCSLQRASVTSQHPRLS